MNYTIEYNQGFYHALRTKTQIQDCPFLDEQRATRWIEGYLEGTHARNKARSNS